MQDLEAPGTLDVDLAVLDPDADGASGDADAVAFGVPAIANPDLVERFTNNAPLNPPYPATFYASGATGYTDYPALQ